MRTIIPIFIFLRLLLFLAALEEKRPANCQAIPTCCPVTCPLCLVGVENKVVRKPVFRSDLPGDEDIQIRRRRISSLSESFQHLKDGFGRLIGQKEKSMKQKLFRDSRLEHDNPLLFRLQLPEECNGPECICANCVCCYTKTKLFTKTETCMATVITTSISTKTATSTTFFKTIKPLTNKIAFTITNTVVFTSTIFTSSRARGFITETIPGTTFISSTFTFYAEVFVTSADVGTITSYISSTQTLTITLIFPVTVRATSVPSFVYQTGTRHAASRTSLNVHTYTKVQQQVYITETFEAFYSVTPTEPTITYTQTPSIAQQKVVTKKLRTCSFMTTSKCVGVDTIKHTPTQVFTRKIGTAKPHCCPRHGCSMRCDCLS